LRRTSRRENTKVKVKVEAKIKDKAEVKVKENFGKLYFMVFEN
jgi:hypothetical protein